MLKRVAGAAVAALGCLAAWIAVADARWRSDSSRLVQRSRRRAAATISRRFTEAELDGLPAPVVRYFRAALSEGQRMIRSARLEQRCEFLLRPQRNDWRPFTATEHFGARPAGFVWNARIRMAPGLSTRVRDGFVEGRGFVRASLLGIFSLVAVEGTAEIAEGALQRYLAEAAWLPTALLPSQGVVWAPLDRSSARATVAAGGTTVSIDSVSERMA